MREDAKTREPRIEAEVKKERKRVPLHGRMNLTIDNERPGWHRCWVAEDPTRPGDVKRYQAAGYTFVEDPSMMVGDPTVNAATPFGSVVTRNGGLGVTLYLMEIPQEWYDEDRAAEEEERKAVEAQIFNPDRDGGQYGTIK